MRKTQKDKDMSSRAGYLPKKQQVKYLMIMESCERSGLSLMEMLNNIRDNLPESGHEYGLWTSAVTLLSAGERPLSSIANSGLFDADVGDILKITGDSALAYKYLLSHPVHDDFDYYDPSARREI